MWADKDIWLSICVRMCVCLCLYMCKYTCKEYIMFLFHSQLSNARTECMGMKEYRSARAAAHPAYIFEAGWVTTSLHFNSARFSHTRPGHTGGSKIFNTYYTVYCLVYSNCAHTEGFSLESNQQYSTQVPVHKMDAKYIEENRHP